MAPMDMAPNAAPAGIVTWMRMAELTCAHSRGRCDGRRGERARVVSQPLFARYANKGERARQQGLVPWAEWAFGAGVESMVN